MEGKPQSRECDEDQKVGEKKEVGQKQVRGKDERVISLFCPR